MKLISFRVTKFRNVVDSGAIEVDPAVTCLVGKNEAGKSALLEALHLFNPAYGDELDVDAQYPRWLVIPDRRTGDLAQHAPIAVTLGLDPDDIAAVESVLGPGVLESDSITVSRKYSGERNWTFPWNERTVIENLKPEMPVTIAQLMDGVHGLDALRHVLDTVEPDREDGPTSDEIHEAAKLLEDRGLKTIASSGRVVDVLRDRLPKFFRFTSYSTLPGRVEFEELAQHEDQGPASGSLQTARALLRSAGTDLDQLSDEDYELRRGELEAVQIELTRQALEYWRQNPHLEVQIDVDKELIPRADGGSHVARYLDIRLRDNRTGYSNNFSQRSSGFQWFFSFLAAFSEFEGRERPIVLLDEPALTLHGKGQEDFLRFINERLAPTSPVLYTTHSPFMVEPDRLERLRIVEDHGPPEGATTTQDVLSADPDSLFPLQAALGYDIAQSLFVGPHNLVVEDTSDYIYLTVMSRIGDTSIDERWRILPAGSATNIPTFVSLIGPDLDVTVLVDSDTKGMQRITNMITRGLLKSQRLIMASVAVDSDEADIEDLFSEGDYLKLYNRTFGTSIKVNKLPEGTRIVKRIEADSGPFDRGRVAETLLKHHHELPFTETTLNRFSALIATLNATIDARESVPLLSISL